MVGGIFGFGKFGVPVSMNSTHRRCLSPANRRPSHACTGNADSTLSNVMGYSRTRAPQAL
jgi:hypothetical protein